MLRQMGYPIPRLLGYMSEQAIYMVNSFQFTRSARLILAYRPLGSVCLRVTSEHSRGNRSLRSKAPAMRGHTG